MTNAIGAASVTDFVILEDGETMNSDALNSLARKTGAALTRRASFLTLGGAAMAATIAHPGVAAASDSAFKRRLKKRCSQNRTRCTETVKTFCDNSEDCIGVVTPCCDKCFSSGFFTCFLAIGPN